MLLKACIFEISGNKVFLMDTIMMILVQHESFVFCFRDTLANSCFYSFLVSWRVNLTCFGWDGGVVVGRSEGFLCLLHTPQAMGGLPVEA